MVIRGFFVFLLLATFLGGTNSCWSKRRNGNGQDCAFVTNPSLIHSLPEGRPVYGVQPMGQEIYIIRDSTPYIEVYDRNTFLPKRNISIANQGPYDMVQSTQSSSLFIADWYDSQNLTVVQVNNGISSRWSFQETQPTTLGLAASNQFTGSNIVVTAAASQKLKKFSPAGNSIQEVVVNNISRPRQAIQVASDRYAVCYGYGDPPELHRVCLVDLNGNIIKCYGGYSGSGVGQLNVPARLEVSSESKGCILVADSRNKRVVLLSKDLEYIRDLISSERQILDGPYRLYLDEGKDLLYVADNTVDSSGIAVSGRVLVFKVK